MLILFLELKIFHKLIHQLDNFRNLIGHVDYRVVTIMSHLATVTHL
jgi:hypothetical protein